MLVNLPGVSTLIDLALSEDIGRGDVTTASTVGARRELATARLVAREPLVVFGLDIAAHVFERVDADIECDRQCDDGDPSEAGATVMAVRGPAGPILIAERTALNFVQRLSGVATLSREFAKAVAGTNAKVVDTRKTTPGYRTLQKAAVLAGGCGNHRYDLGSGVLIKDNHIAACGSVKTAVERAKNSAPHPLRIEVEVESFDELGEAIAAGAEVVLLDNMSVADVTRAAAQAHDAGLIVEVSGGITLDTARGYAEAGADYISVGALTHSALAVDLALDFDT